MKAKKKKLKRDNKNKKSKKKKVKKSMKYYMKHIYKADIIPPSNIKSNFSNSNLITKILNNVVPRLKKIHGMKIYIVPFPISAYNIYITDFSHDYIKEYYNKKYMDSEHLIINIYLHKNLKLNTKMGICLDHYLTRKQEEEVFNIFMEEIPYHYTWNGDRKKRMKISYEKRLRKNKQIDFSSDTLTSKSKSFLSKILSMF